jgi:hypothetical protein
VREHTSRLIQADDVRPAPCSSAENDFDFLTTRKTPHSVMRHKFGLETEVRKMFLNLPTDERAQETETLGFASIYLEHFLQRDGPSVLGSR